MFFDELLQRVGGAFLALGVVLVKFAELHEVAVRQGGFIENGAREFLHVLVSAVPRLQGLVLLGEVLACDGTFPVHDRVHRVAHFVLRLNLALVFPKFVYPFLVLAVEFLALRLVGLGGVLLAQLGKFLVRPDAVTEEGAYCGTPAVVVVLGLEDFGNAVVVEPVRDVRSVNGYCVLVSAAAFSLRFSAIRSPLVSVNSRFPIAFLRFRSFDFAAASRAFRPAVTDQCSVLAEDFVCPFSDFCMVWYSFRFKLFKSYLRRSLGGAVNDMDGYFITILVRKQPQVLDSLRVGICEREWRNNVSTVLHALHDALQSLFRRPVNVVDDWLLSVRQHGVDLLLRGLQVPKGGIHDEVRRRAEAAHER